MLMAKLYNTGKFKLELTYDFFLRGHFVYYKHFTQNHNHLLAYAVCMVLFCLLCVKLQKIICLMLKYV